MHNYGINVEYDNKDSLYKDDDLVGVHTDKFTAVAENYKKIIEK